jgi:hypothetical protein
MMLFRDGKLYESGDPIKIKFQYSKEKITGVAYECFHENGDWFYIVEFNNKKFEKIENLKQKQGGEWFDETYPETKKFFKSLGKAIIMSIFA